MNKLKELALEAKRKHRDYIYIDSDGSVFATNYEFSRYEYGRWIIPFSNVFTISWTKLGHIDGDWNEHNSRFVVDDLLRNDDVVTYDKSKLKALMRKANRLNRDYLYIDTDGDAYATNSTSIVRHDDTWIDINHNECVWEYVGHIEGDWNEHNSKFKLSKWTPCKHTNNSSDDKVEYTPTINAISTLEETIKTIGERGQHYDSGEERSIPKVVNLFNELTGKDLTIKDGYRFMMLLKLVRSTQGQDKLDNYIDLAGYAALCSEVYNVE